MRGILLAITLFCGSIALAANPVVDCEISVRGVDVDPDQGHFHTGDRDFVVKTLRLELEPNENLKGNYTAWPRVYFKVHSYDEILSTGRTLSEVSKGHNEPHYEFIGAILIWRGVDEVEDKALLMGILIKHNDADSGGEWLALAEAETADLDKKLSVNVDAMNDFGSRNLLGGMKLSCVEVK